MLWKTNVMIKTPGKRQNGMAGEISLSSIVAKMTPEGRITLDYSSFLAFWSGLC
jgi:hypothetical protein